MKLGHICACTVVCKFINNDSMCCPGHPVNCVTPVHYENRAYVHMETTSSDLWQ